MAEKNEKNYKTINGNKMARQLAQKFGYRSAEDFKGVFTGPNNASKFNIAIDMNTFEIVLISLKNSGLIISTGMFMK